MSVHPVEMVENIQSEVGGTKCTCAGCGQGRDCEKRKMEKQPARRGSRRPSNAKMQEIFKECKMGEIYDTYITRMYQAPSIALMSLLLVYGITLTILFNVSGESVTEKLKINIVLAVSVCLAIIGVIIVSIRKVYERFHKVITGLVWLIMIGTVYLYTGFFPRTSHTSLDDVPMVAYTIFVTHTMLPLRKRYALIVGIFTGAVGILASVVIGMVRDHQPTVARQVIADIVIYTCVNVVGVYHKLLTDTAHRYTFLETRNYIKSRASFGEQWRRQNDLKSMLLRKVMPGYLVDSIQGHIKEEVDDSDAILDTRPKQFHDLFIKSCQNVSILYADIVKFTPLTASLTPMELVHALNQLFGEFDQLAERHDCYRIKILGDCYYCVSGLPEPTTDHAKNCVRMGKQMIGVIRQIRNKSGIESLDMRIGIHTGNVLSGILGHRKMQYDIWSNAVTIANHMESSGLPGKVHVTQSTVDNLDGEFPLEPGHGAERDELLRQENIVSYLITPSPEELGEHGVDAESAAADEETGETTTINGSSPQRSGVVDAVKLTRRESVAMVGAVNRFDRDNRVFDSLTEYLLQKDIPTHLGINQRLQDVFDIGSKEMREIKQTASKEINGLTLAFRQTYMELDYVKQRDIRLKISVLVAFFVFLGVFAVQMLLLKRNLAVYVTFGSGCLFFALLGGTLTILDYKVIHYREFTPPWVSHPASTAGFRYFAIFLVLAAIFTLSIVTVGSCEYADLSSVNISQFNNALMDRFESDGVCVYQTYFLYNLLISMIACSIFIRLLFPLKLFFLLVMIGVFYGICFGPYRYVFNLFDILISTEDLLHLKVRGPIYTCFLFVTLFILSRQIEYDLRLNYLWKTKIAEEDKTLKRAETINTRLLENILPKHVAKYFLRPNRDRTEVYHSHYDHVTVMFAAITGFLYEENEVNGMGIGSIRLLNEILISFDKLLDKIEYKSIEKIKSINTTYMAAAGLASEEDDTDGSAEKQADSAALSRRYVRQMVRFAFEMMEVLEESNKDSFNDNCALRIGINHGEVIAGVVGAQKPQYDIWGDTVNIASRMESHGQKGRIQVSKDTKVLLALEGISCDTPREMFVKGKGDMVLYFVTPEEPGRSIEENHGVVGNGQPKVGMQATDNELVSPDSQNHEPSEVVTQL
ncbi:adenylate cyclase type 2-like [Lineus longissimus]|uniref:adenylate cyclase type 2-like n=1 Tax=Lineus longissimus TaxID=88925 RepID=UPI002B4E5219